MPIYEYQCKTCETNFEILQRSKDPDNHPKCPDCGKQNTKKRLSSFSAKGTQKATAQDNAT